MPRGVQAGILLWIALFACHPDAWALLDENQNGLSDVWEAIYGGPFDPHGDPDGDSFPNWAESIAGTDPTDPADYPRLPSLRVQSNEVLLWHPAVRGIRYELQASTNLGLWHPVAISNFSAGAFLSWSLPIEDRVLPTAVRAHVWTGIPGATLAPLMALLSNSVPADVSFELHGLSIPQSNPNQSNFATFIEGWIIAPETGPYTFWISGDDQCEFWLSSNSSPQHLQLVARVPGWTTFQQWDKYTNQRSSPIWLMSNRWYAFSVLHKESSGGDHVSVGWTRPSMPSGEIAVVESPYLTAIGTSLAELHASGSLAFRFAIRNVDQDGDGLHDYEEYLLGLSPTNAFTTPRLHDTNAAKAILASDDVISVGASPSRAYETRPDTPAMFILTRSGNIRPLTVSYSVSGTADPADYSTLSGSIHFPAGVRQVSIPIYAVPDAEVEPPEYVVLTIQTSAQYRVGNPASATIQIDDAEDVLYVALLRAPPGSPAGGSGIASVRRAGNSLSGVVRITFNGLSGQPLGVEICTCSNGAGGTVAWSIDASQGADHAWGFDGTNGLSREQILAALDAEALWVRVRTAAHPEGEIVGRLQRAPAWQQMPAPPEPPPAPLAPTSLAEAARFLLQATFGPKEEEILALTGTTYSAWIDAQIAAPPTYILPAVQARRAELQARDGRDGWQRPLQEAWWQNAVTAPDQLRQRMAFALSQIFVISQVGPLEDKHEGVAKYYDLLIDHAFGNFRDLLEAVTLSPMMGTYLSMMRNRKPDPVTGHEPDENYAREIMQLFTIGLVELHPDGSLKLDAEGMPSPTYDQHDIVELAHIFTGWGPHYNPTNPPRWGDGSIATTNSWFLFGNDQKRPMSFYPQFHDFSDRRIVGGVLIPGQTSGIARLQMALDTLFLHPNVGPFIARQLIQRFVTSNPSAGYIHRVASVFNDNGYGVRGDLGATIKAILLDPEARHPAFRAGPAQGKPVEPVIRYTRLLRAFTPIPPKLDQGDSRLFIQYLYSLPEQVPLHAPSVFNFFQPSYRQPGLLDGAGLDSPEFQIFTETTLIREANLHYGNLFWGFWVNEPSGTNEYTQVRYNFARELAILDSPSFATPAEAQSALLDHLNVVLMAGRMSPELRADIQAAWDALPSWFGYTEDRQRQRIRMAVYLCATSPEFMVQP